MNIKSQWYLLVIDVLNIKKHSVNKPMIAVVIPTYNEAENISKLITEIFNLRIENLNIIIIDDNSPDNTKNIIENLKNKYQNLFLINRQNKLGLGSAYIIGFKKALSMGANFIFQMDADFSHNPQDIPKLLESIKNSDLVIGSRKIKGGNIIGWNNTRKLMSNGAMFISRLILKLKPKDVTAGFRCFKKEVLQKINLNKINSNGYAFQEEMLFKTQKLGFKIVEVPVIFTDRKYGKSKLGIKEIMEFFIIIFKLKFKKYNK